MPTWPISVPFFDRKSGSSVGSATSNVIRSPMSVGPSKVRRRSSAGPRPWDGASTPIMSQLQLDTFEEFFYDDLLEGSLSFEAPDPFQEGQTASFRIIRYSIRPDGLGWTVSANLERLP